MMLNRLTPFCALKRNLIRPSSTHFRVKPREYFQRNHISTSSEQTKIHTMSDIERINSDENFTFTKVLSHATKVPGLIFLSGQTPVDQEGKLVPGGIKEHTAQVIHNLSNVLEASGSSWEKVVKVNVYLKNMDDFDALNEVYAKLIPDPKPARTCIQAARLPKDFIVEIEAIATY